MSYSHGRKLLADLSAKELAIDKCFTNDLAAYEIERAIYTSIYSLKDCYAQYLSSRNAYEYSDITRLWLMCVYFVRQLSTVTHYKIIRGVNCRFSMATKKKARAKLRGVPDLNLSLSQCQNYKEPLIMRYL